MRTFYSLFVGIILFTFTACSDNGTEAETENSDQGIAIRLVNTGSEDLEVETDSDHGINFCYKDEGCESLTGGSYHLIYADNKSIITESSPDKHAIGVKVGFKVTAGEGKAEVVRGRSYRDEAGFREFEGSEVVHTSSSFSSGETVSFEYGDTN